jgi:hypothetical protein
MIRIRIIIQFLIEKRILKQIKEKLVSNNAIILKVDKENSIVIIYQNIYHEKVMDFIHNNNFTNITDLTRKFQKELRNDISECPHIIQKDGNI